MYRGSKGDVMPDEAEIERVRLELKRRHYQKRKLEQHDARKTGR